jgi:hypothetical protein
MSNCRNINSNNKNIELFANKLASKFGVEVRITHRPLFNIYELFEQDKQLLLSQVWQLEKSEFYVHPMHLPTVK